MLTQPESSRESEKVVLNGFNKKLAIKVKAFQEGHPGVRALQRYAFSYSDKFLYQGEGVALRYRRVVEKSLGQPQCLRFEG